MRFRFEILSGFSRNAESSVLNIQLSSWILGCVLLPSKEKRGYSLPFQPFSVRLWIMEKVEIKRIGDYLKDLEEGLDAWDYRGPSTLGHLNRLYAIIKHLMDATFKTDDQELKPLLATLEYKARRCKQCIKDRLAAKN